MDGTAGVLLSNQDLLAVWEVGEDRHNADRALLLLAAAHPGLAWEDLTRLPLGSRDAMLIRLRAAQRGGPIGVGVQCPACHERLEFDTSAEELLSGCATAAPPIIEIEAAGHRIRARPLNSRDLVGLPPGLSRGEGRRRLIRKAVLGAWAGAEPVPPDRLPAEALAALAERLAEADPGADLDFALDCPACGHAWISTFDITAYYWRELTSMAQSMLEDVHELATAYGWAERDILAMPPARRAFYLSRIRR